MLVPLPILPLADSGTIFWALNATLGAAKGLGPDATEVACWRIAGRVAECYMEGHGSNFWRSINVTSELLLSLPGWISTQVEVNRVVFPS